MSKAVSVVQAANIMRKSHGIRVSGGQAPPPLTSFAELDTAYNCSKRLLAKLDERGWHEPTAIQRQAMPALLQGRELFAIAPTGQPERHSQSQMTRLSRCVRCQVSNLSCQAGLCTNSVLPGELLHKSCLARQACVESHIKRFHVQVRSARLKWLF